MSLRHDYRNRPPEQVRVVVPGTGCIGRFVVKELVEQGYQVIAFAGSAVASAAAKVGTKSSPISLEQKCASEMSPIQARSRKRPSINQRMWW